jgi:hypothetical protein
LGSAGWNRDRPDDADAVGKNALEIAGLRVARHARETEVTGGLREDRGSRPVGGMRLRQSEYDLQHT